MLPIHSLDVKLNPMFMKKMFAALGLSLAWCMAIPSAYAQDGPDPGTNPNPELLKDEFLYNFTNGKPSDWRTEGEVSQLSGRDTYNASTAFAVRIQTQAQTGLLEQIVTLGAQYQPGDEFEGLLHYSTELGSAQEGALRLAMQWLDAGDRVLTSESERKFLDNATLWFSHMKSWGTLRFRTRMPNGAKKFRFAVVVNKQSNIRLDDFSLRKQTDPTPFVSVLPQTTRFLEIPVGQSQVQHYVVQSYNQPKANTIELTPNIPFEANISQIDKGDQIVALDITCRPKQAGKVPRGNAISVASIPNGRGQNINIPLHVYSIDPKNPPRVSVKPSPVPNFTYTLGEPKAVSQDLALDFEQMIDDVTLSVEPAGSGFTINKTNVKYFEKAFPNANIAIGVNDTSVKVNFKGTKVGTVEAALVIKSPMFETVRIPLKGVVRQDDTAWREKFTKQRFPTQNKARYQDMEKLGYYWFDKGVWTLYNQAMYDGDSKAIFFYDQGAELRFEGGFAEGLIYNEDFTDGIASIKVKIGDFASDQAKLAVEISHDHGGSWIRIGEQKPKEGGTLTFVVNSHQPTTFRLVRTNPNGFDGAFIVGQIEVTPSKPEERIAPPTLMGLADFSADKPRALVSESFDDELHHSPLTLDGWRNFSFAGNRPWVSFQQLASDSGTGADEDVAKVTLYKATPQNDRDLAAFLVSPVLSYTQAKTKELTFRLFVQTALAEDLFHIYLAPINDKGKMEQTVKVALEDFTPGGKLATRTWYDYLLRLDQFEALKTWENFVVIFALQSPLGGSETSTVYLLDDFSWGREDNPVIEVDKRVVPFFQFHLNYDPINLKVTSRNARAEIRTMLLPAPNTPQIFRLDQPVLPAEGGTLGISIDRKKLASKPRDYGTHLYLSTRGGANVEVLLFATAKTEQELSVDDIDQAPNAYAYRQGGEVVVHAPDLLQVEVYNLSGQRLAQAQGPADELRLAVSEATSRLLLVLSYTNGQKQSLKL